MQTRFYNLLDNSNSLKEWPSRENLLKAIEKINSIEFKDIIQRRNRNIRFTETINGDFQLLSELKEKLKYIDENNRLEN
jgi:hypothetical protein